MSNNTFNFKDLRALEHVFVKNVLEARRQYDSEIETICAVSSDAAITRLRQETEDVTKLLSLFAQANSALRHLAYKLDADGNIAAQLEDDGYSRGWAVERRAALDILRRFATRGNDPLTREAEEERNAALEVLVPTMRANDAPDTPPLKHETAAHLDTLPF